MTDPGGVTSASFDILDYVRQAGNYASPLLLIALLWMKNDRDKILKKLEDKSTKVENLAERTIVVMTRLETLFSGKRGSS